MINQRDNYFKLRLSDKVWIRFRPALRIFLEFLQDSIAMMIVHDILEIAGAQGHDEVPQADQGAVVLGEEADHHVAVEDHPGHLLPREQAVVH